MTVSSPFNAKVHYFGGYAQDDWRVGPKLTINYGVRLEKETGLVEENDGFTVAFDRTLNPGGALGALVVNGNPVRGGLVYAGQNGAPRHQGDPPAIKISPRIGLVYSFNSKTVVRAGYGIYWAPWNYQAVGSNNYGNIGFTQNTTLTQNQFFPTTSITNPFPNGVLTPFGNTRGALTGVGQNVEFIDQTRTAPQIHQYSVDLSREIPGNIAVGVEYVGRHRPGPRPRRRERRHHQHQPGQPVVPVIGRGADRERAEPVLRPALGPGLQRHERHGAAPPAAAAVPAVRRHPDAPGHPG